MALLSVGGIQAASHLQHACVQAPNWCRFTRHCSARALAGAQTAPLTLSSTNENAPNQSGRPLLTDETDGFVCQLTIKSFDFRLSLQLLPKRCEVLLADARYRSVDNSASLHRSAPLPAH